jgi:hypothetical protein
MRAYRIAAAMHRIRHRSGEIINSTNTIKASQMKVMYRSL